MADNNIENDIVTPPTDSRIVSRREKLESRLEDINDAIHAVLVGGQNYRIGSRSLTRADLGKLYEMQKSIESELASEDSILMDDTYVAFFDRR